MRYTLKSCALEVLLAAVLMPGEAQLAKAQSAAPPRNLLESAEASAVASAFPGARLFNDQPPFLAGVSVDRPDSIYRDGDELRIQFQSEIDANLYLIYHQADGTSLLLFPNEAHSDSKVAGRKSIVIPPHGEEFRFRIRPPFGRETLQVLASKQPLPELDSLVLKSGTTATVGPELLEGMAKRLLADRTIWTEHRVPITTVASEAKPSERKPARVGLFIGIGKYMRPDIAATHEELRHSAEVMHELMLKYGQLDPNRTLLVRDSEATKANLRKLIAEKLPSVTHPGDTVFIYFSGHAGQLDTNDPLETDGKDETIGPYDLDGGHPGETRAQAEVRFRDTNVTDDTLAAWLSHLQGRQVVVILDTCHGGGVVEGKGLAKTFWQDESTRLKDISQLNTLVLASCAADEQSLFEGTQNKTMWFTYCLTEAIERAAGREQLTVQDAYEYSRRRMRNLLQQANSPREQEPVMADRILLPLLMVP